MEEGEWLDLSTVMELNEWSCLSTVVEEGKWLGPPIAMEELHLASWIEEEEELPGPWRRWSDFM